MVGFDLDLTLVDSAEGIARTLRAALAEDPAGTAPPDEVLRPYVGIPLELTVRAVAPGADVDRVATRYRELYPAMGVPATTLLPGVHETFAAIRARGGGCSWSRRRSSRRCTPSWSRSASSGPGAGPDVVVGGLFAGAKGVRLRAEGAQVYVGDHPGRHGGRRGRRHRRRRRGHGQYPGRRAVAAGADVVLPDLRAFPGWFADLVRRVVRRRQRRPARAWTTSPANARANPIGHSRASAARPPGAEPRFAQTARAIPRASSPAEEHDAAGHDEAGRKAVRRTGGRRLGHGPSVGRPRAPAVRRMSPGG